MLRVNNVNVDELYRRGVMNKGSRGQPPEEEEEELPRTGVELLRGEDLLSGLD
jgi:hypothetical protein